MDAWLLCSVGPGQFSSEFAVVARSSSGQKFSLFAPREFVVVAENPSRENRVAGKLRVEVLDRSDDGLLVHLPGEPMDNGRTVTVKKEQIEEMRGRQRSSR